MSLKDKLMQDLKAAMKSKNKTEKMVITMIRAAVKQYEVDTREDADDQKVLELINKEYKKLKDSIVEFKKAERLDLVEEAEGEVEVILKYLPKQLTEEEVRVIVSETIAEVGAQGKQDMGKVMGALMPKVKGLADGKLVSSVVKELL